MKYLAVVLICVSLLSCTRTSTKTATDSPRLQSFETPELAVKELLRATAGDSLDALIPVIGNDIVALLSEEEKQSIDARKRTALSLARQKIVIDVAGTKDRRTGRIFFGDDEAEFPIPLIEQDKRWQFDRDLGFKAMLQRAIRRNELTAIATLVRSRDSAKKKVQSDGYAYKVFASQDGEVFKAKRSSVKNDDPALAYPVNYGRSGRGSFLIDSEGNIFRADLGRNTQSEVQAINKFSLSPRWKKILSPK